jgi:hypothetical protein
VRSARSATITAVSSFPSCCRPIRGDGRPSARAAASQVVVGHTRPPSRPPRAAAALHQATSVPGQTTCCPATRRVRQARHRGCHPPGRTPARPLVRVQLLAHGMRSALIEVHARHWGMAHLMAGRGSPPAVGAGWLFSVWPQERPLGTAAPCGTTASSRLFPDIVFTDTYTYRA